MPGANRRPTSLLTYMEYFLPHDAVNLIDVFLGGGGIHKPSPFAPRLPPNPSVNAKATKGVAPRFQRKHPPSRVPQEDFEEDLERLSKPETNDHTGKIPKSFVVDVPNNERHDYECSYPPYKLAETRYAPKCKWMDESIRKNYRERIVSLVCVFVEQKHAGTLRPRTLVQWLWRSSGFLATISWRVPGSMFKIIFVLEKPFRDL